MAFSMAASMGGYMAEKQREIIKIDIDNIVDDENNDFEVEGSTEIETKNDLLKDSIEQFGLLDPCTVRPMGDGKYKLISGHRRTLMHRRLAEEGKEKFRKVDCIIMETDDMSAEQILLEANIPSRQISDWEKAKAVERMTQIFEQRKAAGEEIAGRRREHIAKALGMSTSAVGRMENINKNLAPEYKDELKNGSIGVSVADKLASKPAEEQKKIFDAKGAKVKLYDLQPEQEEKTYKETIDLTKEYSISIILSGKDEKMPWGNSTPIHAEYHWREVIQQHDYGPYASWEIAKQCAVQNLANTYIECARAMTKSGRLKLSDLDKDMQAHMLQDKKDQNKQADPSKPIKTWNEHIPVKKKYGIDISVTIELMDGRRYKAWAIWEEKETKSGGGAPVGEYETYYTARASAIQYVADHSELAAEALAYTQLVGKPEQTEPEPEEERNDIEAGETADTETMIFARQDVLNDMKKRRDVHAQMADIDRGEGNDQGEKNQRAVVDYYDELIAKIVAELDDLKGSDLFAE